MKIGIFQTAFLGDTILIASMLDSIKQVNNDTEIYLIIKKGFEPVFENDPRVRSIISYDKHNSDKGIPGMLRLSLKLRKLKLDYLLNIHRSFRSAIVCYLAGAKNLIGFREASLSFLFNKTVKRTGIHEVYKNHLLLEAINNKYKKTIPDINKSYKLYADTDIKLPFMDNKYICIAPGSRWLTKSWTIEGYSELINMITQKYEYKIVISGDNNDINTAGKITEQIKDKDRVINLCGKLNLGELILLIMHSDLLISNDSAPQHLAAGFSIPAVSVFGPTVQKFGYYPFNNNAIVVENNKIKCRPCGIHGHMKCPVKTHECMNNISASEVFEAVQKLIMEKAK